jgi:hypothetical protein
VKQKLHQQKVVCDLISGLLQQSLTENDAINQIYLVYGVRTSVAKIINAVKFNKNHRQVNFNLSC